MHQDQQINKLVVEDASSKFLRLVEASMDYKIHVKVPTPQLVTTVDKDMAEDKDITQR